MRFHKAPTNSDSNSSHVKGIKEANGMGKVSVSGRSKQNRVPDPDFKTESDTRFFESSKT